LPREILKQKGNDDYLKLYQEKTKELETACLNFGALAIVSGIKQDQAKQFLTDLFALLIEINRKNTKEVRLNFSGLGSLRLFKNGELSFD